jgi:hypothetical protein
MWCWRTLEKIIWIEYVRGEEVLRRDKDDWNTLHTIQRKKANWDRHMFFRNCLLKQVIEGKIEGWIELTGR